MTPRRPRWLKVTAEIVLIVALIAGVRAYVGRHAASGPAPAIDARTLAGDPVSLAARRGRPVLVHFWATWCPVCRAEQGAIAGVAQDYRVITIAMQSGGDDEIRRYLAEHDWRVPVVNDADGRLTRAYGVHGVPTSFVVDSGGTIRAVEVGYTTEIGLRLRLWWAGRGRSVSGRRRFIYY